MKTSSKQNVLLGMLAFALVALIGCSKNESESANVAEEIPKVPAPDLPEVPKLPPPPYAITYPDGSYSIYGLRRRIRQTLDSDVEITGYIVEVYKPPKCTEKKKSLCPTPIAPHIWVADSMQEADRLKQLIVVGYADNQEMIDQARRRYGDKIREALPGEPPPVPTDFEVGKHVRMKGRFTLMGGIGFNSSNGLLEYAGHQLAQ